MPSGWSFLIAGAAGFVLSLVLTRTMIWLSPRIGFVDKPGHRKIHANPKPLGGGVAIFWSFALCLVAGLAAGMTNYGQSFVVHEMALRTHDEIRSGKQFPPLVPGEPLHTDGYDQWFFDSVRNGLTQQTPLLAGLLLAACTLHVMGLFDDRRAMGPYSKLLIQLAVTAGLVIAMELLARHTPSLRLRVLTTLDGYGLGPWPSIVVTVLWIGAITNAFNFLDNMDGLSAGVAAVCTMAFLATALSIGQWFVAGTLSVFLGSLLGFLVFNYPPAKIFMGDSGSLVVGFVLGVLTVRTTFLPPDLPWASGWYATLAPLIVLAVPVYDMVVVSVIRISRGVSPFKGDTNHLSHRLVARGMSRRTAVLCIYLITAATSIAAILLPQVRSGFGAVLICLQTVLVLGVVLLLEQHKAKPAEAFGELRQPHERRDAEEEEEDENTKL